jgi:hypothetical protein
MVAQVLHHCLRQPRPLAFRIAAPAGAKAGGLRLPQLRKNRTFFRSGRGDGQPGRQNTPMVATA